MLLTKRRPRTHLQSATQALRSSLCRSQCLHDHSTPNQGVSDHLQPPQVRKDGCPSFSVSIAPAGGRRARSPAAHVRGDGLVRSKCPITARLVLLQEEEQQEGRSGGCGVVSRGAQQRQVQVHAWRRKTLWWGWAVLLILRYDSCSKECGNISLCLWTQCEFEGGPGDVPSTLALVVPCATGATACSLFADFTVK